MYRCVVAFKVGMGLIFSGLDYPFAHRHYRCQSLHVKPSYEDLFQSAQSPRTR